MNQRTTGTTSPFAILMTAILTALFVPSLFTDSVVTALTATPLRQAVSTGLAACIVLGVCYWSVPCVTVDGSDTVGGGH
jgi:hypothetical protein